MAEEDGEWRPERVVKTRETIEKCAESSSRSRSSWWEEESGDPNTTWRTCSTQYYYTSHAESLQYNVSHPCCSSSGSRGTRGRRKRRRYDEFHWPAVLLCLAVLLSSVLVAASSDHGGGGGGAGTQNMDESVNNGRVDDHNVTPPVVLRVVQALLTYSYPAKSHTSHHSSSSSSSSSSSTRPTSSSSSRLTLEEGNLTGIFGFGSMVHNATGQLLHVLVADGANHGCSTYTNHMLHLQGGSHDDSATQEEEGQDGGGPPKRTNFIALVSRGVCKFQRKIDMADMHNASAIVIYNNQSSQTQNGDPDELLLMNHIPTNLTAVLINHEDGVRLAQLVDADIPVQMSISVYGYGIFPPTPRPNGPKKHTTVVLLTFVGFLIVGLIVVVVYAVKHAKHVHARSQANMAVSLQGTRQGQEALLNNIGPPEPPPPLLDPPPGPEPEPAPAQQLQQLQAQALLPQIREEEEEDKNDQQQQNHQALDVPQSSPLLPH